MLEKTSKIFVAGHRGLAGAAILKALLANGYSNLLLRSRSELDLASRESVFKFFEEHAPDVVVLAAAKVGGIKANESFPADFIRENLLIQTNVIDASWKYSVRNLLFLGSSCVYPRDCPQPIQEDYLLTGPLEVTNRAYAVAKIAGIELCDAYNRQFGTQYICAMPTNLYGLNDNFDPDSSHVLPALLGKFSRSARDQTACVTLWGDGSPRREFLHADDLGKACVHLLERSSEVLQISQGFGHQLPIINVGSGEEVSIRELAELISRQVGFRGEVTWDSSKPNGTPRKLLASDSIRKLGWEPSIKLKQGIELLSQVVEFA